MIGCNSEGERQRLEYVQAAVQHVLRAGGATARRGGIRQGQLGVIRVEPVALEIVPSRLCGHEVHNVRRIVRDQATDADIVKGEEGKLVVRAIGTFTVGLRQLCPEAKSSALSGYFARFHLLSASRLWHTFPNYGLPGLSPRGPWIRPS